MGFVIFIIFLLVVVVKVANKLAAVQASAASAASPSGYSGYAGFSAPLVCPHCQTAGRVTTKMVKRKKGISGGKAVGALLTGGASLLVVGLSRKERTTAATCGNCSSTWDF